jgi:hypothetical protein
MAAKRARKRLVAPAKPIKVVLTLELEVNQLDKLTAAAVALRETESASWRANVAPWSRAASAAAAQDRASASGCSWVEADLSSMCAVALKALADAMTRRERMDTTHSWIAPTGLRRIVFAAEAERQAGRERLDRLLGFAFSGPGSGVC